MEKIVFIHVTSRFKIVPLLCDTLSSHIPISAMVQDLRQTIMHRWEQEQRGFKLSRYMNFLKYNVDVEWETIANVYVFMFYWPDCQPNSYCCSTRDLILFHCYKSSELSRMEIINRYEEKNVKWKFKTSQVFWCKKKPGPYFILLLSSRNQWEKPLRRMLPCNLIIQPKINLLALIRLSKWLLLKFVSLEKHIFPFSFVFIILMEYAFDIITVCIFGKLLRYLFYISMTWNSL